MKLVAQSRKDFIRAMDDDLNTPKALAVLFNFIRRVNAQMSKDQVSDVARKGALEFLREADGALGLGIDFNPEKPVIPAEVARLLARREQARKDRDWQRADDLRKAIQNQGYIIEDTPQGPRLK